MKKWTFNQIKVYGYFEIYYLKGSVSLVFLVWQKPSVSPFLLVNSYEHF